MPLQSLPVKQRLRLAHLNAHSVCNKTDSIRDLVIDNQLDVCAILETWLYFGHMAAKDILPPGYALKHKHRPTEHQEDTKKRDGKRGGGVAVIHRDSLTVSRVSSTAYSSMECLQCLLKLGSDVLRLVIVYRRPPRTGGVPMERLENSFLCC